MKIKEIKQSENGWTWILTEDDKECPQKHDTLYNERSKQQYVVHTENPYTEFVAIWTGKDGVDIDVKEGDEIKVTYRSLGEFD